MEKLIIRMAKETDAEEILAIYSYYIVETPITFEYEKPNIHDFKKRIREINGTLNFRCILIKILLVWELGKYYMLPY